LLIGRAASCIRILNGLAWADFAELLPVVAGCVRKDNATTWLDTSESIRVNGANTEKQENPEKMAHDNLLLPVPI